MPQSESPIYQPVRWSNRLANRKNTLTFYESDSEDMEEVESGDDSNPAPVQTVDPKEIFSSEAPLPMSLQFTMAGVTLPPSELEKKKSVFKDIPAEFHEGLQYLEYTIDGIDPEDEIILYRGREMTVRDFRAHVIEQQKAAEKIPKQKARKRRSSGASPRKKRGVKKR